MQDLIENYLIKCLSTLNVVQCQKFSKEFRLAKLEESCVDFLVKCSKKSIAVYGSESLDKDFLASMFLGTLRTTAGTNPSAV